MDDSEGRQDISDAERRMIVKDAEKLLPNPVRRLFMKRALSVGALVMLSGCDLADGSSIEEMLRRISRFNERFQAALFDPNKLAPEYPASMIDRPFRSKGGLVNGEYPAFGEDYKLRLGGSISNQAPLSLEQLGKLPQTSQITRLICTKGWSVIGKWGGVRFSDFLRFVDADLTAKFVGFKCGDGRSESIDMPSALHPQTMLALTFDDQVLPPSFGYPLRLRIPTKLGYKNPKHIIEIFVTNTFPEDRSRYREDWFGGL